MDLDMIMERRRSVRKFKEGVAVSSNELETIIKASQEAPSWKNQQTSRYHVVSTPETLSKLKECLHPWNQISTANAPVLIVCTFKINIVGFERSGEPSTELGNEWGVYDLGLQNSYLLLKASEIGLSTLVLGLRDASKISELLGIPDNEMIVSVIAVGHGDEIPEKPARKEISDIVKFY